MRHISSFNTSTSAAAATAGPPRSPWHSPVPYLFGGLAAMLGLIAFALLILACSYWRLSGRLDDGEGGEDQSRDGEDAKDGKVGKAEVVFEEKFLVIMAGNQKPTFLATPRAAAYGEKVDCRNDVAEGKRVESEEEKTKEEMCSSSPRTERSPEEATENGETARSENQ